MFLPTDLCIIQVVKLFADYSFVELWAILLLHTF